MSIERVTSIHRTDWSDPTYNCMVINDHEDGEFDVLKECGQHHDSMIDWSECPVAREWVLMRNGVALDEPTGSEFFTNEDDLLDHLETDHGVYKPRELIRPGFVHAEAHLIRKQKAAEATPDG